MQFPQLFGSDYILPAIIAIVLLAAVLALLMLRKRKPGGTVKQAGVPAAPQTARPTRAGRKAAAAAAAAAATGEAAAEQMSALGQEPGSEPRPAPAPAVDAAADLLTAPEAATPAAAHPQAPQADLPRHAQLQTSELSAHRADPLGTVLASILQGWGDLTTEDTNRLEVFRRDKVLAAIAAADLPKDLKSSEYAKTRLIQLKRYANYLDQGEKHPIAVGPEFAGIATALGSQEPQTQPAAAPAVTAAPATATVATAAAAASSALAATAPAAVTSSVAQPPSPEQRAADFTWGRAPVEAAQPQPGEESPVEFAWDQAPVEIVEDMPEDERPVAFAWEAEAPKAAEETVTEPSPPSPAIAREAAWTSAVEAHKTTEEAAAAAAFWATPDAPRAEEAAADAAAARGSLSSLHGRVSTAADILALPAREREDMLAFLEPAELSKVFRSSDDAGLKRAVIDTLEHVGSPASLDVLQQCLEDPDPLVQMYALDAADRLLGAGS